MTSNIVMRVDTPKKYSETLYWWEDAMTPIYLPAGAVLSCIFALLTWGKASFLFVALACALLIAELLVVRRAWHAAEWRVPCEGGQRCEMAREANRLYRSLSEDAKVYAMPVLEEVYRQAGSEFIPGRLGDEALHQMAMRVLMLERMVTADGALRASSVVNGNEDILAAAQWVEAVEEVMSRMEKEND